MEPLIKEGTSDRPGIILDKDNGKFEFSGKSLPENPSDFFAPVFKWIKEYSKSPNKSTRIKFKMIYFNTASSKIILDILEKFERIQEDGYEVIVEWYYSEEDEDMEEAGEEYSEIIELPFELNSY